MIGCMCGLPEPNATRVWCPWVTDSVHESQAISRQVQLCEKFAGESSDGEWAGVSSPFQLFLIQSFWAKSEHFTFSSVHAFGLGLEPQFRQNDVVHYEVISSALLWICYTNNFLSFKDDIFLKSTPRTNLRDIFTNVFTRSITDPFVICLIFIFFLHTAIWHSRWRGWKPDEWRSKTEDSYRSSSCAKPENPATGYGYVSTW